MDRIALVIGNSEYINVSRLNNPVNDANDISNILSRLQFKVVKIINATRDQMYSAINSFLKELDDNAVGLFYYAGHGMQIDGKNYLIPIDCEATTKEKTVFSSYCMEDYLNGIAVYRGKTNICILDACRNNPFANSRGMVSGFSAFISQPQGTIIAFSTSPDSPASDGISNGLYTEVLKDSLLIPNIKIEDMFKSVRIEVSRLSCSRGLPEQISWEHSSLMGDFYFSVKKEPVNPNVSDNELYSFICERTRDYEKETEDVFDIECMPFVEAYEKYKIPIIKIARAYLRIEKQNKNTHYSDQTIDQINISYLKSWGFYQLYDRWYYKDRYVEMGDPLPLEPELSPLPPEIEKELKIGGRIKPILKDGKLIIHLYSNIPEGTPLLFSLSGKTYNSQCKVTASHICTISEEFSKGGNPLWNGFYKLNITCPTHSLLPENIKKVFGERSRNITGDHVVFNPIGGNTINLSYSIQIKSPDVFAQIYF